jgi:hypothetical protein
LSSHGTTTSREIDGTALDALVVRFAYLRQRDAGYVDPWVSFALTSTTTKTLTMDFMPHTRSSSNSDRLHCDLPCRHLSAGTPAAAALEHLYLRRASLRLLYHSPGLTNLKTLVMSWVRVTSEDLDQLLSSSLKLHSLELEFCEDLAYVKAPPPLRVLIVKNCWSMITTEPVKVPFFPNFFNLSHAPF